jgi:hypothetical protein
MVAHASDLRYAGGIGRRITQFKGKTTEPYLKKITKAKMTREWLK